jgi:predicted nucleic acid-binding protein
MLAVDTNVIVRLIAEDHPEQARAARSLLRENRLWVSKTVILETIWVLGRFFPMSVIQEKLSAFVSLEGVEIEDEYAVAAAFDLMEQGLDPADAMHLASTPSGLRFATFDRDLIRLAKRAGATNVAGL